VAICGRATFTMLTSTSSMKVPRQMATRGIHLRMADSGWEGDWFTAVQLPSAGFTAAVRRRRPVPPIVPSGTGTTTASAEVPTYSDIL
jgi:hypothetical protein